MRTRIFQVNARVSSALFATVCEKAKQGGVSVSEYVRRVLIADSDRVSELTAIESIDGRATGDGIGIRQIQLTRGFVALVDEQDFERVNQYRWNCMNHGAAQARIGTERVQMHRFILGLSKDDKTVVDHINHNRLDNRRCNLRVGTHADNSANRVPVRKTFDVHGGFKGVVDSFRGREPRVAGKWARQRPPRKRWRAVLNAGGKRYDLGGFPTPEDAARAYDAKAIEVYGEYALLNFPERIKAEASAATA